MSSLYKLLLTLTLLAAAGIIFAQPLDREHLNVGAQVVTATYWTGRKSMSCS